MEYTLKLPISKKTEYLIQMLNPVMGNLTDKEIEILVVIADKQISIINKDKSSKTTNELVDEIIDKLK